MANRDFSDSVKLSTITENLRKNNGEIRCEACGKKLLSITDCHFDHIFPYAKGGTSTADNCQILCVDCNLKKTDKELNDFLLEEKAKAFFSGSKAPALQQNPPEPNYSNHEEKSEGMTKDKFDDAIADFIQRKGEIRKIDFSREYNHLPSIHYVRKYYGDLQSLQKAFGVEDLSYSWNRESIKEALMKYVEDHGDIIQTDLKKKNLLPSLPCILSYYPEYSNFTEIKKNMLNLVVREKWNYDSALKAGQDYVKDNGKITESSLGAENHLPTSRTICTLFGSLAAYQKAVGSEVTSRNEFISEEEIEKALDQFFSGDERIIVSRNEFFSQFPYSISTVYKRYGSFQSFCKKYDIKVLNTKKAKFTKQEVDDAIANWIKSGKDIPLMKELSKSGLPSAAVIMKYYESWKEPFVLYKKLYEKLN